jgi:serine protease Do
VGSKISHIVLGLCFICSVSALGLSLKQFQLNHTEGSQTGTPAPNSPTPVPMVLPSESSGNKDSIFSLNEQLVAVAGRAMPAVVTVFIEKVWKERVIDPFAGFDSFFDDFFFGGQSRSREPQEREFRSQGLGSGVILSKDGYILTNNHVVADATTISVNLLDRRVRKAKVIGKDPKTDLAVIKIEESDLPFLNTGDSSKLRVGEIVLAVGSPMSPGLAHTVTQGIVSAVGRSNVGLAEYEDFIQTDAAINPGNSGGALVNIQGDLVGINSAIVSQSGGSQGIGFAIPINMAKLVMDSLIKNGKVIRGWIGVATQEIREDLVSALNLKVRTGILISDIDPNSSAASAGLQRGDVILRVEGEKIDSSAQFRNRIAESKPGQKIKLDIQRGDTQMTKEILLQELPVNSDDGEQEQRPMRRQYRRR